MGTVALAGAWEQGTAATDAQAAASGFAVLQSRLLFSTAQLLSFCRLVLRCLGDGRFVDAVIAEAPTTTQAALQDAMAAVTGGGVVL